MVFVSPATFNHFYTFAKEAVLTVNNFFRRNSRSLGELRSKKTIVEQVALSVQASQDEQNNGVKHLETVSSTLFTLNFVYLSGGRRQSLWKIIRAQHLECEPALHKYLNGTAVMRIKKPRGNWGTSGRRRVDVIS